MGATEPGMPWEAGLISVYHFKGVMGVNIGLQGGGLGYCPTIYKWVLAQLVHIQISFDKNYLYLHLKVTKSTS